MKRPCVLEPSFNPGSGLPPLRLRPGLSTVNSSAATQQVVRLVHMLIRTVLGTFALASVFFVTKVYAAQYADGVVAYSAGTGFATEFGSGIGYTNATAALGEPSRVTPGTFGGPVDPFSPPFSKEQLVSIGAGGSLTLRMSSPIPNDPNHRFGIDFTLYGNSGFVITNGNFSGGGITDGSLFSGNPGATRVSVSQDGQTYYQLDPNRAPAVDTLFPTDGSGSFDLPVNPAFTSADFAGLGLDGIRNLYAGSGGGLGFDLAWAQDAIGQSVSLDDVRFIRIEVLSGVAEVDGVAVPGVVPEPEVWTLFLSALGLLWIQRRSERVKRSAIHGFLVESPGT